MRADARRNREKLVAVAEQAFAEHGAGASLDDIAKRAGVGPGTLCRHFPTREALQEGDVALRGAKWRCGVRSGVAGCEVALRGAKFAAG